MSSPAIDLPPPARSRAIDMLRLGGVPGLIVLVLFACIVVGGIWRLTGHVVTPYDPVALDLSSRLLPPTLAHPFGTDSLGRDVLSRVVAGAWFSLMTSMAVIAIAATIGTLTGAVAGLLGGLADEVLMRITDLFLAFPALVLAAAISATFGGGLATTALALAAVFWPWYARIARARILGLKNLDFVTAAITLGASRRYLLLVTLPPLLAPTVLVQMTMDVAFVTLSLSSLSFLGLGVQSPLPEWGGMVYEALPSQPRAWWLAAFPGGAIALTALAFNLLGDRLRDQFDPDHRRNGD